jgi:hypothetical protein
MSSFELKISDLQALLGYTWSKLRKSYIRPRPSTFNGVHNKNVHCKLVRLVSSAPENVSVNLVTNSTIALHWLKPSQPNGLIAGYRNRRGNKLIAYWELWNSCLWSSRNLS